MSDYDVGYRKPPKDTQFKKGQSGNPKGRPKGSKNKVKTEMASSFEDMLLRELYRDVEVSECGATLTIPLAQLAIRSLAAKAAKGDIRAQKLLLELGSKFGNINKEEKEKQFEQFCVLQVQHEELLERHIKEEGTDEDFPHLPHPKDILVYPRICEARFAGPIIQDELQAFTALKNNVIEMYDDLKRLENRRRRARSATSKQKNQDAIARIGNELEERLDLMDDFSHRWPRHWPIPEMERWRLTQKILRGEDPFKDEKTMEVRNRLTVEAMMNGED